VSGGDIGLDVWVENDELQADPDDWFKQYNHERTHSGK